MSDSADTQHIREQAALWAARLEGGDMTAADQRALDLWLNAAAEHRSALTLLRNFSAELAPRLPGIFEKIEGRQAVTRRWRLRRMAWGIGSLVTAAAASLLVINAPRTVRTEPAESHAITLADGTRIELNGNTEIQIQLDRKERRIVLLRGEALFQVAKDSSRPFVVNTSFGRVSVTGTVFDVRSVINKNVEVTVIDGVVEVQSKQRPADKRSLRPDMQAELGADSVLVQSLGPGAARDSTAWRDGQVVFENTRLDDAMAHFSSYHDREIVVDPAVANLRLGGRYNLNDLDALLRSLPSVLPIRIIRQGSAISLRAP